MPVPTIAGRVAHDTLHDVTRHHPTLAEAFWRDALIDAAVLRERLPSPGQRSTRGRPAHPPCEAVLRCEAVGLPAGAWPLARIDLAHALGAPVVQVNRELLALQRGGLIALRGATVEVLDVDELVRLGDFDPAYLHQERAAWARTRPRRWP